MVKILWLTNILPHFLAKKLNRSTINNLGWLDYSAELLLETGNIKLFIVFPSDLINDGDLDDIVYYGFPTRFSNKSNDLKATSFFNSIIVKTNPDVIHIFGTEYHHTLAMVKAAQELGVLKKVIISIQGLVSVYANHFFAGLPDWVTKNYTFRDFLKRENQVKMRNLYIQRGISEKEALKLTQNVMGRTEWDKACTEQINPNRKYFFCNETLRETFYSGTWAYEKCEPHSLFVSQSSYSIKGLHKVLEAMISILIKYPDAKVYVTGMDVFKMKWYRINSYHSYLKMKILQFGLRKNIIFLGSLDADQMKLQFLNCNAFLMPSSIENSPNSLGEAMILGVPSIAADVGGISSMFTHNVDGYLYPFDEPYMLAHYVCQVFSLKSEIGYIQKNAHIHASRTHSPEKNRDDLLSIYSEIGK